MIDFKKLGILLIIVGGILYFSIPYSKILLFIILIFVMLGLALLICGIIDLMIKTREKYENIDKDIETKIQPIVTKYSKINKELMANLNPETLDEYLLKRKSINLEMENELSERLPYLKKKEITDIIKKFNKAQEDKFLKK
jgi:flagellar basal body-associated protein FliL